VTDSSELLNLQAQVAAWHARRFPKAKAGHVCLKATVELGELAEALLDGDEAVSTHRSPPPDVVAEAADVAITVLALIGRFYPRADLMGAVAAKLAILDDPDGTHRSSIGAMA
jgi:hypothetical protein